MLETLEGLIRSPRSILWADGTHEVRYVPPRSSLAAALLGTKRVSAHWGWAGEKAGFPEHLRSVLLLSHTCKLSKFCHVEIIFPQPASR